MSNHNSEGPADHDEDDRGELAWNEFDWEHYLREQDEVILRYLGFYDQLGGAADRLDEVAHRMGWDQEDWSTDGEFEPAEEVEANPELDTEPYTLHKNPIFVATKAIYLGLTRAWERLAENPEHVSQRLALTFQSSLHRGEELAVLGIQALDFGDYAMAISLFKRALRELNTTLAMINLDETAPPALRGYAEDAQPRLFDLREIWLRVMGECREELAHPTLDDDEDE
jgi:hypothetical protein